MISVAQEDHPYLLEWLGQAQRYGGGFLSSFAHAAMVADNENYPLIRPLLLRMYEKYQRYQPSEAVQRELAIAVADFEEQNGIRMRRTQTRSFGFWPVSETANHTESAGCDRHEPGEEG